MSGIYNGTIRFMNLRKGIAAIEIEGDGRYSVVSLREGIAEPGDQIVGNLDVEGAVDLFNRTRRDRISGVVSHAAVTRDVAMRELSESEHT